MVKPNGMLQVYPTETYVPKNHYSKQVVNPYTQGSNPQHAVVNPYTQSGINVKTPYPIFDCSVTKKWSNDKEENDNMIEDCVKCLQNTEPHHRAFYCDGMCTSEYSLNKGQCSYNSLVASNIKQCLNPCQKKIPENRFRDSKKRGLRDLENGSNSGNGCKNDTDCGKDQKCVIKNIIAEDGTIQTNVGVCEEKKPLYNPEIDKKTFNIINLLNDCTSDDLRLCITDISNLKETELKELIQNKIKDSKDNNTFDNDKQNIIKLLKKLKEDPELLKNGYDIVDNTISKLNYTIKELNNQYNLSGNDKGTNIDTNEIKSEFIIDEINTDKNLKEKLQNIFPNTKEEKGNSILPKISDNKKDLFINVGTGIIIFLIVVLILLLIFYRKGSDKTAIYKSVY